jgi:hypothetical protein
MLYRCPVRLHVYRGVIEGYECLKCLWLWIYTELKSPSETSMSVDIHSRHRKSRNDHFCVGAMLPTPPKSKNNKMIKNVFGIEKFPRTWFLLVANFQTRGPYGGPESLTRNDTDCCFFLHNKKELFTYGQSSLLLSLWQGKHVNSRFLISVTYWSLF